MFVRVLTVTATMVAALLGVAGAANASTVNADVNAHVNAGVSVLCDTVSVVVSV